MGEAIQDAGLDAEALHGVPVLVGTGLRELRSVELWHTRQAELNVADLHFARACIGNGRRLGWWSLVRMLVRPAITC